MILMIYAEVHFLLPHAPFLSQRRYTAARTERFDKRAASPVVSATDRQAVAIDHSMNLAGQSAS
jgi:hypothetical protein